MEAGYISISYRATKTNTFIEPELREKEIFHKTVDYPLTEEILELLKVDNGLSSLGVIKNPEVLKQFKLPYDVIKHEDNIHIHSTLIGYEIISAYLVIDYVRLICKINQLENIQKQYLLVKYDDDENINDYV